MVGFGESQKVAAITKVFGDSYKSPLSVIVIDNIERLLGEYLVLLVSKLLTVWDRLCPNWSTLLERGASSAFSAVCKTTT